MFEVAAVVVRPRPEQFSGLSLLVATIHCLASAESRFAMRQCIVEIGLAAARRGTGRNRLHCGSRFRAADHRISARLPATGGRLAANRSTIQAVHRSRQSAARPRLPLGCGPGAPRPPAPLRISRSPAASTPPHRRAGDRRLRRTTFADPGWSGSRSSPQYAARINKTAPRNIGCFLTKPLCLDGFLPAVARPQRVGRDRSRPLMTTRGYRWPVGGSHHLRQVLDPGLPAVGEFRIAR